MMLGIAVADVLNVDVAIWLHLSLFALLLMVAGLFIGRLSLLFGVGALLSMFSIGATLMSTDDGYSMPQWNETKGEYSAVFVETPHMGDKTVKAPVMLTRLDGDTVGARSGGLAYLYIANCVDAENLKIGECISFAGKVKNPQNAGNPAEFDMERYLYVKGVTGTAYLPVGAWRKEGVAHMTLRMRALALREKVVHMYVDMGFDEDVAAVLRALTIGDKSELTSEITETFSSVGASHILALSGLHLGIFYMILSVLLPMWRNKRAFTLLRELLILMIIWSFVFVAGLSASLTRAALLFTIFSFGRCLRRDASSLNSLALAAIVMLLFSPRSLFDVSFQLSFAAVFSILLLRPSLRRLLAADRYGKVYGYVADVVTLSIAAQIGTFPFVWYYFGTFPLYFLFTNMLVVPVAFIIMSLAVLLWLSSPITYLATAVAWFLNVLVGGMNEALRFLEQLPLASIELPYIDAVGAWLVAFSLLLCGYICLRFKFVAIFAFLGSLLFVGMWLARLGNVEHDRYMLFYNSRQFPAVHFVQSRDASYLLSTMERRFADVGYITEPYIRRHSFAEPRWVCGDYSDACFSYTSGIVKFCNRSMKLLRDASWQEDSVAHPVDVLFLCKGFKGAMEKVLVKYPTKWVVMDAGLHAMSRKRVAKECSALGVACFDLSQSGAMFFHCVRGEFAPCFAKR